MTSGLSTPVAPKMRQVLEILLPKTFPKTSADSCLTLAIILTITSGKDVPMATKVKPIISSEIPYRRAKAVDPSTTIFPPCHNKKHPTQNKKISIMVY